MKTALSVWPLDLRRWISGGASLLTGGRAVLVLLVAVAGLWGYARLNAARMELAESRVEDLSGAVDNLEKALALTAALETARREQDTRANAEHRSLDQADDPSLDRPLPPAIRDLLRQSPRARGPPGS